ncbi:MAG: hypothetical protein ACI9XP_000008 [Lentimonas sp.]|jgi:hypothetical protein
MKKLLKHILFLILPVLAIILAIPIDKRLKYKGLKDDCFNHGVWIHDRIFNNEKPIDIAFLGSSHSVNGINDKIITDNLKNGIAVNLSYCRLGRNLSFSILKELIGQKKPKHLILEVREDEDRYSHPIFPYIARTSDVLLPNPFFNRDILSDMWTHIKYKTELLQDMIFHRDDKSPNELSDYGFAASEDTASIVSLEEAKQKRSAPNQKLTEFERNFQMNFPRTYLRKIHDLCIRNKVRITFLYLPAYGSSKKKPMELTTYRKYGEVLFIPKLIMENQNYWHDEEHFNQAGAQALSLWVSSKIGISN